jgi:hypothetical protein
MLIEDETAEILDTVGSIVVVELIEACPEEEKICGLCAEINETYLRVQSVSNTMEPIDAGVIFPWRNIERVTVLTKERALILLEDEPEFFN